MEATNAANRRSDLASVAAELDALAPVPDGVLLDLVTRDGSCMESHRLAEQPQWSGDDLTDRDVAARICAGCPVRRECLELQLRTSGAATLGVWGALPGEDVRALFPVWQARRLPGSAAAAGGERP
jgi:WhiB family redox-sensing transcriptional regulator